MPENLTKRVSLTTRLLWEFTKLTPILQDVVAHGFDRAPSNDLWISSINRTRAENDSAGASTLIHVVGPPFRACDAGWENMNQVQIDNLCVRVNAKFTYDPSRPHLNVAYGAPHGTGLHVHFQVHPNTIKDIT